MRITRDLLLKAAYQSVTDLIMRYDDVVSIYLTGSLIEEQPLLGGVTDIDLICIHSFNPPIPREVVRLVDEFHLDIAHYPQSHFSRPISLRQDAWLGSFLCYKPISLYDTQHWFEFTQAGVFAQFLQPDYTLKRVRPFIEQARQKWLALKEGQSELDADEFWEYCKALEYAGNAIACLVGVPLTERRFLIDLPARAQALDHPTLSSELSNLIKPPEGTQLTWQPWLKDWSNALLAANEKKHFPVRLNPLRIPYYEQAISVLSEEHYDAALWTLLRTWALSMTHLPKRSPHVKSWQKFLDALNLGKEHFRDRLIALDGYLEVVEDTLSTWAKQNGL